MSEEKKTPLQNLVYFVFGYLSFYAITASAVQWVTESSPLLEVYNWVLGVMIIVGLITKFICDNFEGYPQWGTWPFKFMFAVSGIMGAFICYEYNEFLPEISSTYGSR